MNPLPITMPSTIEKSELAKALAELNQPNRATPPSAREGLRRIRHVALDMDGTIYRGGTLFEFTRPFLSLLKDLGIGYTFLTNNSSKSVQDYVAHLRAVGIESKASEFYTSTNATIEFLREELPSVRRLFVLGTRSMSEELFRADFVIAEDSPTDEPDAVIVGFDTALTFARLCRAAYWIKKGKPFIASHPDRVCPTDEPTVLVDCGSVCAALAEATGRKPDAVLGKPDPRMLRGLLHHKGLNPEQLAMIGDRLYTDVAMAHRAGTMSVLVLTGEATAAEAAQYQPPPDFVMASLAEFGEKLRRALDEN
jgi:HAD superfamily hydrolase (TIGR01450 family)